MKSKIDPDAEPILKGAGYDESFAGAMLGGFLRKAYAGEAPGAIAYEELDRHHLVQREGVTESARAKGLEWLRRRVKRSRSE